MSDGHRSGRSTDSVAFFQKLEALKRAGCNVRLFIFLLYFILQTVFAVQVRQLVGCVRAPSDISLKSDCLDKQTRRQRHTHTADRPTAVRGPLM